MASISSEEEDYYLILPSNVPSVPGSSAINRPDEFRTLLPRPLEFSRPEEWEIGLSDIIFPQTFSASIKLRNCSYQFRERKEHIGLVNWIEEQKLKLLDTSHTIEQSREISEYSLFLSMYREHVKVHDNCPVNRRSNKKWDAYEDLTELIEYLNSSKPVKMKGDFDVDSEDGRVTVTLQKHESMNLDRALAEALGFERQILIWKEGVPVNVQQQQDRSDDEDAEETRDDFLQRMYLRINRQLRLEAANRNNRFWSIKAENLPDLRMGCYSIFIYSNLVRETLVGHMFAKILRTIPVRKESDGKTIGISFHPIRYRPLASNFFEYVDIKLCDDMGNKLEFRSGKVIVTIRIRRRRKPNFANVSE